MRILQEIVPMGAVPVLLFEDHEDLREVVGRNKGTKLTGFFRLCKSTSIDYRYVDIMHTHVCGKYYGR